MQLNINDEYSSLKTVVVASGNYFNSETVPINNETIRHYVETNNLPNKEIILKEQKAFWDILKANDVKLLVADEVNGAKGQMFTRDLGFVIKDNFFISNMKKENRRQAIKGWNKIISKIPEKNVIKVPENIFLEGGDILVDNQNIYVGISQRTTILSVEFLKQVLPDTYNIIPIFLQEGFLHLDVVFTIINPQLALVYKEGIKPESYKLLDKFKKIEVTKEEQLALATNVIVLNPQTIIMNTNQKRIKKLLTDLGFNVITTDLKEISKAGGAFRCTTCPLYRQ